LSLQPANPRTSRSTTAPVRGDGLLGAGVIICLVTDRQRLGGGHRCLLEQTKYAIGAGVDLIQLREHDLDAAELADLAGALVMETQGSSTRLVVNDRLDVALATGAHGVHLRQSSIGVEAARRMAPPGFLIGCSVHNADEAAAAVGADYLIAGTIFESPSKPDVSRHLGTDGLEDLAHIANVPVLAIGGVTVDRVAAIACTGARGIAAIGLFMTAGAAAGAIPSNPTASRSPVPCRAFPLKRLVEEVRRPFANPHPSFDSVKPSSC
jgi:thiamine-phosphate diphosphorylase